MSDKQQNYAYPLGILTSLFFAWGFITALNDVLIPYLKNVFELTIFQSTLVQFAFFGAYFIGSVVYFLISTVKGDPIAKIGYKNGIILGLIVAALGCFLFFPAAEFRSYGFFLFALFTLGLGLTLLQIAANPYVALLGRPETASSRLNLSQGFNSFGTTISPVIGGYLIFEYFQADTSGADSVKLPYIFLAASFLLLAVMIRFVKLPTLMEEQETGKTEVGGSALKYNNLVYGIGAIFCYVGAEVAIGSLLVNFLGLKEILGIGESEASNLLALYWGGAMVGRFVGSISMSDSIVGIKKIGAMVLVSMVLYVMITFVSGFTFQETYPFLICVAVNIILSIVGKGLPARTLFLFALSAAVLLVVGVVTKGNIAMWAILGIGLFNSIMWSNIFTLSIAGLGKDTSQGSSLLVMAILGGALIPPIQGAIADVAGLQTSFLFPVVCYVYLMFFGLKGYKPLKRE
ncbi:sugar MFS transporter [Fulvivirga sp. M361]|uniref:sugar MFS transporter n=1 Tax=Fulvivirga sp. M361 TaxID=2594266 RepID=UPI00117A9442|nr:sugar MFS transporter [Fulvivirga sp. M361]TRX53360.1 sugar MFS transporter [Fulvivirga sp. M361]